MAKLNPDYLIKDELEFEVRLRGEVLSAIGVSELRNLVRSGQALVESFENEKYAEDDLDLCKLKADELLAQVSDLGLDPDLGSRAVFRLRLRLEHLLRRFSF